MSPIPRLLDEAFAPADPAPASLPFAAAPIARQRKLWRLPAHWLGRVIGASLSRTELRRLAEQADIGGSDLPDYTLHAVLVGLCARSTGAAELVGDFLDELHAAAIQRLASLDGADAVVGHWRESLADGNAADLLWAVLTHDALNDDERQLIYGEFHMLAHDAVRQAPTGRQRLLAAEKENARLREEAASLRQEAASAQRDRDQRIGAMATRIAELEQRALAAVQDTAVLDAARQASELNQILRERHRAMEQRLAVLEARNAELQRRNDLLESRPADASVDPVALAESAPVCPGVRLAGRRVLCIGGLTRLTDRYRQLVEAGGGRFYHHDGGQEESMHRIDAMVANVDVVVCQAGCVSHNAYWLLKDACKRHGLPCVYLKSAGITSFARGLEVLGDDVVPPPVTATASARAGRATPAMRLTTAPQ
jgi:hypothetical protein